MRSGLQKQVLSLYKQSLRIIQSKAPVFDSIVFHSLVLQSEQASFYAYIRSQFNHHRQNTPRSNINAIEYRMRQGRKELDRMQSPSIKSVASDGSISIQEASRKCRLLFQRTIAAISNRIK
jgi:hypothetical protein